jgi:hypothetical protein
VKIWVLLVMCVGAGCYSPSLRECSVACASPADCGGGQVCTVEGWCAGTGTSCEGTPDAPPGDTSMPDANDLCERSLGCTNGSCVAGVCVIDCSAADSCPSEISCPPNIPCRVTCGDRSCDDRVLCGNASSCEVVCAGIDACSEEVHCGKAPCTITCSGAGSCKKKIKCKESCACDVSCVGVASCFEAPECPLMGDACRLGKGCSSDAAGCDRCE